MSTQGTLFDLEDFPGTAREEVILQYNAREDYLRRVLNMDPSPKFKKILMEESFNNFLTLRLDADLRYLPRPDFETKWHPTTEEDGMIKLAGTIGGGDYFDEKGDWTYSPTVRIEVKTHWFRENEHRWRCPVETHKLYRLSTKSIEEVTIGCDETGPWHVGGDVWADALAHLTAVHPHHKKGLPGIDTSGSVV